MGSLSCGEVPMERAIKLQEMRARCAGTAVEDAKNVSGFYECGSSNKYSKQFFLYINTEDSQRLQIHSFIILFLTRLLCCTIFCILTWSKHCKPRHRSRSSHLKMQLQNIGRGDSFKKEGILSRAAIKLESQQ